MMSEKRFKLIKPLGTRLGLKDIFIKDTVNDYYYNEKEQVVDLLNEQQALISALKKENKQLKAENNTPLPYVETGLKFARAEKKIGEQQAEIERLKKELDEKCP